MGRRAALKGCATVILNALLDRRVSAAARGRMCRWRRPRPSEVPSVRTGPPFFQQPALELALAIGEIALGLEPLDALRPARVDHAQLVRVLGDLARLVPHVVGAALEPPEHASGIGASAAVLQAQLPLWLLRPPLR